MLDALTATDERPVPWGVKLPSGADELDAGQYRRLLLDATRELSQRVPVSLATYPILFLVLGLHSGVRGLPTFWGALAATLMLTAVRWWNRRLLVSDELNDALEGHRRFYLLTVLQGLVWGAGVVAPAWLAEPWGPLGVMVMLSTTGITGGSLGTFTYSMRANLAYQALIALPLLCVVVYQTAVGVPDAWLLGLLVVAFLGFMLTQGRKLEREYWVAAMGELIQARQHQELILAREAAESAARSKGLFLATMSHELRTPLNGVIGMVQLLRSSPLNREQEQYIRNIASSGGLLLEIIDDILDTVQLERGQLEIGQAPFDPVELVDEVLGTLAPSAWSKELRLSGFADASVPALLVGDQVRLRQVLVNLVGNGLKFTNRGRVWFRLSASAPDRGWSVLRMEVRDTGPGLGGLDLERIFEAFEQGDQGHTRRHGGSGLGLKVSRALVEQMGGRIGAEDLESGGAFFWAEIPSRVVELSLPRPLPSVFGASVHLADGPERDALVAHLRAMEVEILQPKDASIHFLPFEPEQPAAANMPGNRVLVAPGSDLLEARRIARQQNAEVLLCPIQRGELFSLLEGDTSTEPSVPQPALPGLRVLLVEDNPVNQLVARRFLEQEGVQVGVANDGIEALTQVRDNAWDLVLMDLQMPRMDGLEATRRIRSWEEQKGHTRVPIVALTANVLPQDRERCTEVGMDEFLPKPLRRESLVEVLSTLAARGRLEASA